MKVLDKTLVTCKLVHSMIKKERKKTFHLNSKRNAFSVGDIENRACKKIVIKISLNLQNNVDLSIY